MNSKARKIFQLYLESGQFSQFEAGCLLEEIHSANLFELYDLLKAVEDYQAELLFDELVVND